VLASTKGVLVLTVSGIDTGRISAQLKRPLIFCFQAAQVMLCIITHKVLLVAADHRNTRPLWRQLVRLPDPNLYFGRDVRRCLGPDSINGSSTLHSDISYLLVCVAVHR